MVLLVRIAVAILVALILAGPAPSLDAQPAKSSHESTINLKTSRVYILVDKKRLGHPHAVEGNLKSARLILDAKSAAGQIVFDMTTFAADTESARKFCGLSGRTDSDTQKKVNDNMLGSDVLDVEKFPTATFEIESSLSTGKKTSKGRPLYELNGEFTLHGTTHPLSVVLETEAMKDSTRLRGKFRVLQTDFGIKPYTAALGTVGVADELTIWGEIDLKQ